MKTQLNYLRIGLMVLALIFTSCTKENGELQFNSSNSEDALGSTSVKGRLDTSKKDLQSTTKEIDENDLKQALTSIEILLNMKYPVKRWESFSDHIKEFQDPALFKVFEMSFSKKDFPLLGKEETLKIHYSRNSLFDFAHPFFPKLPSLEPKFPDTRGEPSPCTIYSRDFAPAAAACGCQTYAASVSAGEHHLIATLHGIWAARRYARTGVCN